MDKDIVKGSIEILKTAAKISTSYYKKALIVAYSGGKDSDVLLDLALKADIPFEVVHSLTTVDAPETMRHINKVFKSLHKRGIKTEIKIPHYKGNRTTMWKLIVEKGIPPTRLRRYCCQIFKEVNTPNRVVALGVRAAESKTRQGRDSFSVGKKKKYFSLEHTKEVFKDAEERDPIWDCELVANARKNSEINCNPIYKWSDCDIWAYIQSNNLDINPLYEKGRKRVGCIMCPLAKKSERWKDAFEYPRYKDAYIRAFERMLEKRAEKGKGSPWKTGYEVFKYFIEDNTITGQLRIDPDTGEIVDEETKWK